MKQIETSYILGIGEVPNWCRKALMAYRKIDGSIGFEFFGAVKTYKLSIGDVLIKDGNKIKIKRKAAE